MREHTKNTLGIFLSCTSCLLRKVDHCVQTELSHYLLHKSGMSVGDWSGRQQWLSKARAARVWGKGFCM